MTDQPVTHEAIETAFKPAADIISRLPETTETREAQRLVGIAEKLTHESRERTKAKE